jgi:uncharacterized membrane protein YsdA (DUF1294 family)
LNSSRRRGETDGSRGNFRAGALIGLAVLLVLPALAVLRLTSASLAKLTGVWFGAVSAFAFFAYFDDKQRAQSQESTWRTPEKLLHFLELIGGWPGGFLARAWLRHKSAKLSFRVWSWLIIAIYQVVAADALLGWRMTTAVRAWIGRFF